MSKSTKVYILGAGCSVCGNYPIANRVTEQLRRFGRTHLNHEGATELKEIITRTCRLLEETRSETLDKLAQILSDKNRNAVREAKLSLSALFFSLEDVATESAYPNYAEFFHELFHYGGSSSLEDRANATPCRVITYNYDRLFERTFIEWAKHEDPGNPELDNIDSFVKKFLNMGIHGSEAFDVQPCRFSFLKLHGGIGQANRTGDYGLNFPYWPEFGAAIPPFLDKFYYEKEGQKTNEPTIVFPWDKQNCDRLSNGNSFGKYIKAAGSQAIEFCKSAKEIQIIGYSIQSIDYFDFKRLIVAAEGCERIVVRNRAEEESKLRRKLEALREESKATWEVEYKAEDFFASESKI